MIQQLFNIIRRYLICYYFFYKKEKNKIIYKVQFVSFISANFIVQFLILSFILGIPILTLQVCLGQRLSAGAVDMWRISPLFQGVGIALLLAQAFIGIYSIIGVSWIFVYFRYVKWDSTDNKNVLLYMNCSSIKWILTLFILWIID